MEDSTIITARPTSMSSPLQAGNFMEWGPVEIEGWLGRLNFDPELILKFTANNIVGSTLSYLTDEHFKELDLSLPERVKLKLEINKLIVENGFIKQNDNSELELILSNINDIIQSNLDDLSRALNEELYKIKEEMTSKSVQKPLPTPDKYTNPSSPFNLTSPTKQSMNTKSPTPSELVRRPSHNKPVRNSSMYNNANSSQSSGTAPHSPTTLKGHNINAASGYGVSPSATLNSTPSQMAHQSVQSTPQGASMPQYQQPVTEQPLKQLRASSEDKCSKILQAAMKRHKLNDQDWRNYALVICYGDKERVLGLDEKPVLLFKELKDRGEHPAIMLRQKSDFNTISSQTPGGQL